MQQIPSLLVREKRDGKFLATPEITEGCEWVTAGEGVATEKFDGTACLVVALVEAITPEGAHGSLRLYRRHRHKEEKGTPPEGWFHWSRNLEQRSGHGWIPVGDAPADRWHREAWLREGWAPIEPGTYELVGPRVQKNPYKLEAHELWLHGSRPRPDALLPELDQIARPRNIEELLVYWEELLRLVHIEGVVYHHEDGRMAKLKRRDFGIPWP